MNTDTILEIRGLNKYFGPTHANRDIDISVKKGEIKGLIGENAPANPRSFHRSPACTAGIPA